MNQISHQIQNKIHFDVEDQSRLITLLCSISCVHSTRTHDLSSLLTGMALGLNALKSDGHSAAWTRLISDTRQNLGSLSVAEPITLAKSNSAEAVAKLMIEQPSTLFTPSEAQNCQRLAAKALILNLDRPDLQLPNQFALGLKQLFKSLKPDWTAVRGIDLDSIEQIEILIARIESKTAKDFLQIWRKLGKSHLASPFDVLQLAKKGTYNEQPKKQNTTPISTPDDLEKLVDIDTAQPEPDDSDLGADLFAAQRGDSAFAGELIGFRLPYRWDVQSLEEHRQTILPLAKSLIKETSIDALSADDASAALHAAAAFICLFSGLPIKRARHIPFYATGSLFLDLEMGTIVRDGFEVAKAGIEIDNEKFSNRWWRTPLPLEVFCTIRCFVNKHVGLTTFGELLDAERFTNKQYSRRLNAGWPSTHRPESARFARSLPMVLHELGIHPSIVCRTTGFTHTTARTDQSYLSLQNRYVNDAVGKYCDFAGLTLNRLRLDDKRVGSAHFADLACVNNVVCEIQTYIFERRARITPRSSIDDVMEFSNQFTLSVLTQILIGTGMRPQRFDTLSRSAYLVHSDFIAVSDKDVSSYARTRPVPLSSALKASRLSYLSHLEAIQKRLKKSGHLNAAKHAAQLLESLRSSQSAFPIFEKDTTGQYRPRPVALTDFKPFLKKFYSGEPNFARHFLYTHLIEQNVEQVMIDAFLGHSVSGSEPFGISSGLSFLEYARCFEKILSTLHQKMGILPIVGLGQTNEARLRLLKPRILKSLPRLENEFLDQKIAEEELLVPDMRVHHQGPFCSAVSTLVHQHIRFLRQSYLSGDCVKTLPAGCLVLCLIVLDVIVTVNELKAFYEKINCGEIFVIDQIAVIELTQNGRPIIQRLISKHTVIAAQALYDCSAVPTFDVALDELTQLLSILDNGWPTNERDQTITLLLNEMTYCVGIELPPFAQTGIYYKVPFLRKEDIARIIHRKPCRPQWELPREQAWKIQHRGVGESLFSLLRKWADKENAAGEQRARRIGLTQELFDLKASTNFGFGEQCLAEWLTAELSDSPPARSLKISTLNDYAVALRPFFHRLDSLGSLELDGDEFKLLISDPTAERSQQQIPLSDTNNSKPSDEIGFESDRWTKAVSHVTQWIAMKGFWTPQALTHERHKKYMAPRLPVYLTRDETEEILSSLDEFDRKFPHAYIRERLQLQRHVPLRDAEARFAKLDDLDAPLNLLHVTTSGHTHLKTESSRGTVCLKPDITKLLEAIRIKRGELGDANKVRLIGDVGDARNFDAANNQLTLQCSAKTGRDFRMHDLRASAVTDLVTPNLVAILRDLAAGKSMVDYGSSITNATHRYERLASASAAARHASTTTTNRSYNLSTFVEIRHALDRDALPIPSIKYLAAVTGKNRNTLDVSNRRLKMKNADADPVNQPRSCTSYEFPPLYLSRSVLPTFTETTIPDIGHACMPTRVQLIRACLLGQTGLPLASIAEQLNISVEIVQAEVFKLTDLLTNGFGLRRQKAQIRLPRLNLQSHFLGSLVTPLAEALAIRSKHDSTELALVCGAINPNGSSLVINNQSALNQFLSDLLKVRQAGIHIYFQFSKKVRLLAREPTLEFLSKYEIHPLRVACSGSGLGCIRFSTSADAHKKAFTSRHFGEDGRLAILAILASKTI